jgi:hypothetical protein
MRDWLVRDCKLGDVGGVAKGTDNDDVELRRDGVDAPGWSMAFYVGERSWGREKDKTRG